MTARTPLPGEFAILAFLLDGPMHGYQMAKSFEREALTEVCPLEQSILYTYLRNLEEHGLVSWTETRVGNRPPRKIYELTGAGEQAVLAWLREPVRRMREVRLEFLLKLYFLHHRAPEAEVELLGKQIAICETYRERVEADTAPRGFAALLARSRLSAAEGTLAWLKSYAHQLEHAVSSG